MSLPKLILVTTLAFAVQAHAQTPSPSPSTTGTMVVVPAFGEVSHANDQAILTFGVEEQDEDKNAAAARVNQKMTQGVDIVRREDPQAELKTRGYFTYPVYPENPPPQPLGSTPLGSTPVRTLPIGWRVGQYLEVKTTELSTLPKMAAAAQEVLAINDVQFGLSPATTSELDDRRIDASYRNLNERIVSIARAMGRNPADAVLDTVDFEGSGNYGGAHDMASAQAPMRMLAKAERSEMPEPSFEPGETTLQMRLVGKVRFK